MDRLLVLDVPFYNVSVVNEPNEMFCYKYRRGVLRQYHYEQPNVAENIRKNELQYSNTMIQLTVLLKAYKFLSLG